VGYAARSRGGQGARCDRDGLLLHPPNAPADPLAVSSSPGEPEAAGLARAWQAEANTRTGQLRARPTALAAGEGAIWVFNEGDGTVQRIDGKSGQQLATLGRAGITVGGGFVWVGTTSGAIIQIDPRTNSVLGKFKTEAGGYIAIGYGGSSLWMCGEATYRIAPPR
jgi:DNA-binding beta-propeller fold protein YncE